MNLYLDASALVKRYVAEAGSAQVGQIIAQANVVGTALISRAEVSAALGKAVRIGVLTPQQAAAALQVFRAEWGSFVRIQLTESVIARADDLAWSRGLRGYDAVHLAAALFWQDALAEPVTVATFDRQLWQTAGADGLIPWPDHLG